MKVKDLYFDLTGENPVDMFGYDYENIMQEWIEEDKKLVRRRGENYEQ